MIPGLRIWKAEICEKSGFGEIRHFRIIVNPTDFALSDRKPSNPKTKIEHFKRLLKVKSMKLVGKTTCFRCKNIAFLNDFCV